MTEENRSVYPSDAWKEMIECFVTDKYEKTSRGIDLNGYYIHISKSYSNSIYRISILCYVGELCVPGNVDMSIKDLLVNKDRGIPSMEVVFASLQADHKTIYKKGVGNMLMQTVLMTARSFKEYFEKEGHIQIKELCIRGFLSGSDYKNWETSIPFYQKFADRQKLQVKFISGKDGNDKAYDCAEDFLKSQRFIREDLIKEDGRVLFIDMQKESF